MFLIDDITVAVAAAVMAVALISPFLNVLMSRLKDDAGTDGADGTAEGQGGGREPLPGISVVVTVDDEGEQLKENLPSLLRQDYPGEYQVIVVVSGNDELTENTLKSNASNPRLYTTFIPDSSRYMSRRKLAITVGIKAAKHEWVMLTDVDCRPDSDKWLATMARRCSATTDLVAGYSSLDNDSKASRRFDHAYNLYRQLAGAQRGAAWAYCGSNLMFRKQLFISRKGFEGNLKYIRGEYDFIVNKYSDGMNTAVELSPDARVTETGLTDKGWKSKNMFYMATRKRLDGTAVHRLAFNATMWMMTLAYAVCIAAIVFSALTARYVLTAAAAVALILTVVLRCVVLARSLKPWLDDMSWLKLWWLELTLPVRNMARMMKYRMADKYDFISHKI